MSTLPSNVQKIIYKIKEIRHLIKEKRSLIYDTLAIYSGTRAASMGLGLLCAFSILSFILWKFPPDFLANRHLWGLGLSPRGIEAAYSVDTLFSGLWAIQATLIALVYPVTFSFATLFLQKEYATKASLQAYLVMSGAKLTGFCGLALLSGLTVLAALISVVPLWTTFGWLVLGAIFVTFNLLLTANFLVRTFSIVTPSGRKKARLTYLVGHVWPTEWFLSNSHLSNGASSSSSTTVEDLTVSDCLDETLEDLHQFMEKDNYQEFRKSLQEFKLTLTKLVTASMYRDSKGVLRSRALVQQYQGEALRCWVDSLRMPLKRAISISHVFPDFAKELIVSPSHLFNQLQLKLPKEASDIFLTAQFMFILELFRSRHQSTFSKYSVFNGEHDANCNKEKLYMSFAAAWERMIDSQKSDIAPNASWGEPTSLDFIKKHLNYSSDIAVSAISHGKDFGLNITLDMLLRWSARLSRRWEGRFRYNQESWRLTTESLRLPWDAIYGMIPDYIKRESDNLVLDALDAVAHNYWKDCCAVLAYTIIQEYLRSSEAVNKNQVIALSAILNGKLPIFFEDGLYSVEVPYSCPTDFMFGLIRQHVIDGGYKKGYRAELDGLVERCRTTWPANWIQGRVSSHNFFSCLEDVRLGQAFFLTVLCRTGWTFNAAEFWERIREAGVLTQGLEDLDALLYWVKRDLESSDLQKLKDLWEGLFPDSDFDTSINYARDGLSGLLRGVEFLRS